MADNDVRHEPEPLPGSLDPFLLLGVDKNATTDEIISRAATRREEIARGEFAAEPRDVELARAVLTDKRRRIEADLTSLNMDTAASLVRRLSHELKGELAGTALWQPLEVIDLADESSPPAIPDPALLQAETTLPPIPSGYPAALELLDHFLSRPLDPWDLPSLAGCSPDDTMEKS